VLSREYKKVAKKVSKNLTNLSIGDILKSHLFFNTYMPMKKTTSLFGLLVWSLIAITVAFTGLWNVTNAQNLSCELTPEQYVEVAKESFNVARTLRVDEATEARVYLDKVRSLIQWYCNVSLEESRRISIRTVWDLTDLQKRTVDLGTNYLRAIQKGDIPLANRLMESMISLQEEDAKLIARSEGTIVERTAAIREKIDSSRTQIHSEFTTNRLCTDPIMYNRLTTIVNSIEDLRRLERLESSIGLLLAANPSLQNSLLITRALTNNRIAILDDRWSNPTWETPGFDNTMRPWFCLSVIATDGVTITIDGTSYNTTKDTNLFVTEPVALQDRTTYNLQVVVGDEMVFENAISFNVAKSADYKIAYNIHSPEALTITEVEVVEVVGCMDEEANNYDPDATKHDSRMCEYDPEPVLWCTDDKAINYNRHATEDDGSCEYDEDPRWGEDR